MLDLSSINPLQLNVRLPANSATSYIQNTADYAELMATLLVNVTLCSPLMILWHRTSYRTAMTVEMVLLSLLVSTLTTTTWGGKYVQSLTMITW
jgi:hypothetical protein